MLNIPTPALMANKHSTTGATPIRPERHLASLRPGRVVYYGLNSQFDWDHVNKKRRPGVIVAQEGDTYVVVKGTSVMKDGPLAGVVVEDHEAAGLRKPTRFVPTTTFRVKEDEIHRTGKMLPTEEFSLIQKRWNEWKNSIQTGTVVWYALGNGPVRLGVVVDARSRYLTVLRMGLVGDGTSLTDPAAAKVKEGTLMTSQKTVIEHAHIQTRAGDLGASDLELLHRLA